MGKSLYNAKILKDSITKNGDRLTTVEATYYRGVHGEMLTHRTNSRNSASSRAIPVSKMLERVRENPFVPFYWGKNQSGMSAREELAPVQIEEAKAVWMELVEGALRGSKRLHEIGLHKQLANRPLEPYMYITAIYSATTWSNFFALRDHPDAAPEIQLIAQMIREEYEASIPTLLQDGEWHMPMIDDNNVIDRTLNITEALKVSTARAARVSYLTHVGLRDIKDDIRLHDQLLQSKHFSPFEHCAQAMPNSGMFRNFQGWWQYRCEVDGQ